MFVLYNILQLLFLPVFLPFIILFVLFSPKYRSRIPARLGIGLGRTIPESRPSEKTFWIHALSVGEVTSAVPLVSGLRRAYPDSKIVVSVTTRSGRGVADDLLRETADHIIDGPLDLLPVVCRFYKLICPDLFILVETDFWPNNLLYLHKKGVPAILVNGRVSAESMTGYQRMPFFFRPMFRSFAFLSMQTKRDKDNMAALGIAWEKLHTLGNLKFDTPAVSGKHFSDSAKKLLPEEKILFTCGSTHPGEEEILIDCCHLVRRSHPELFLILAPRRTNRAVEIQALAADAGMIAALRSENRNVRADMFILDTIGELVDFYAASDIGFVGGSLVEKNGHNPIEPAAMGLPVIFGPNMQDFSEIADDLLEAGGAIRVSGIKELSKALYSLLESPQRRDKQGQAARQCVQRRRGVIDKHLELIRKLL